LHYKVQMSDEFKLGDIVQVIAEAQTESQELLLTETHKMVKEMSNIIEKMQKDNIEGRKKAERNGWIRTLLGVILGFILGKVTAFAGF